MAKKKKTELETIDLGIECLISGAAPKADEVSNEVDDEGTMVPVGWIRISVDRALPNPEYVRRFQAREGMIATAIQQAEAQAAAAQRILTDEERAQAMTLLRDSFEAQFHSILAATPKYIVLSEEVWIAPPESSKSMQKEWNELAGMLGVTLATTDGADTKEEK